MSMLKLSTIWSSSGLYSQSAAPGLALDALQAKLNDENWVSLMQVGVLVSDDDPARASDLLARSAEFAPTGSKTLPLVAHGDLLVEQGDWDEARRAYQLAIVDSPFVVESHLGLARVLEETGDLKGARQEYEAAAQFDPGNTTIPNLTRPPPRCGSPR